jgi:anthranilate synthase component 2
MLKCKVEVYRNDKIKIDEIKKNKYQKIVISPGPGYPNQAGNCIKIVKYFYKTIPILGVCLGHQIIGQVFKSRIVVSKKLMHGKTSLIKHNGKGIFKGIKKVISATRYHSLIISKKNFSKDLIITAETADKTIMGIMHKKYNVHGVQFHPESIKSPEGMNLLKNFLKY